VRPGHTHRGAWIGVTGRNLDVAQAHPGIETGRERFTNPDEYLGSMGGRWRHLPSSLRFRFTSRTMRSPDATDLSASWLS
jgi:hypothetical protein